MTGISKAVAARIVGPPHGTTFIVPAPSATIVAKTRRSIFNFKKIGNIAGTVIKKY